MPHRRRLGLVVALVLIVTGAVAVLAHDRIGAFALRGVVGSLGYRLDAARIRVSLGGVSLLAPHVTNRAGEPVFDADRVDVSIEPRGLLPGSTARFGLRAVDLERPRVTLIHHRDGTYNIALPGGSGPPARPDTTPFNVRLHVRDGSVAFIDRFVVPGHERKQTLERLTADAQLAPTDPAYYRVDAVLDDGTRTYPISGRGRFDHARRFAAQRWHAGELPIGPLVDFAIVTHDLNLVDGRLRALDARLYGFIRDDGSTDVHVGGSALLERGKLYVSQLAKPIGDAHGLVRLYADGADTSGVDATLAGVPLHVAGGIFDVAHPHVRFLVTGSGPLARLRTIAKAAARYPIDGTIAFALRADGPLSAPLVRGTFSSPHLTYGAYAFDRTAGRIAFRGEDFQIVGVRTDYGPLAVGAEGVLRLAKHVDTTLVARVGGSTDDVPYAGALAPHAALDGVVVVSGTDSHLGAHGALTARGNGVSLDAPFDVDADGVGAIGPVALQRADGADLYARVAFDRPHGDVSGVVDARSVSLRPARGAALPGLRSAALPAIAGRLDAHLVGGLHGSALADLSGSVDVRGAAFAGTTIGNAHARLTSDGNAVALRDVRVRGPLADLDAAGGYDAGVAALRGRMHADLAGLTMLRALHARGTVDGPFAVSSGERATIAQVDGLTLRGASIDGVPLQRASATLALRHDGTIEVPAAHVDLAGGSVDARGRFGAGGQLVAALGGIDASTLHGAGVPLAGGRITGALTATGTASAPHARALLALQGASYDRVPIDATVAATYVDDRLTLDDVRAVAAGATASASGHVDHLGSGTPQVTIASSVFGADVATLARIAHLPLRYPAGSLDADVRVAGAASAPHIDGAARLPEGSLNGLAFRDVVVPLHGTTTAVHVAGGRATVGTTQLGFDANVGAGHTGVAVRSSHVDLADFNDYFDTADTLAGRGSARAALDVDRASLATSGTVALTGTRYRRIPIGEVAANWTSAGRAVRGTATVGGAHGTIHAGGVAVVPAIDPLGRIAASSVDVRATAASVDLTTWLPAVGVIAPVTGLLDGNARVRGVAPRVALSGSVALRSGTVGRVAIRRLDATVTEAAGRARLVAAHLDALNASATASGTFGLAPNDPLALSVHAVSPDVVALENAALGRHDDGAGALDTVLALTGTPRAPHLHDVLDLTALRYENLRADRAHVDVAFGSKRLTLAGATLDLPIGQLALDASVPATTVPPYVDRRNAPIAGRLRAQNVDVSQFASLLPKGTQLGGRIDGDVAIGGMLADPSLTGTLALTKGSYVSHELASQVRNATLRLGFAGHDVALSALHADVGGGAVDGTGHATVGDLRDPGRTLAFAVRTRERNVGIDAPKYLRGKIDGTLDVTRDRGAPIDVGGDLAFSHTRIPLSALMPKAPSAASSAAPLPVAFNLRVDATQDDRVQGPIADVGAKGSVLLGGTLATPTLAGTIASTDGTLSFYRTFVLQDATVAFDPASGIIPNVDATATTHIPDPSTDVLLRAHGPATGLTLDFASNEGYDRAQILGLLVNAQALGAVSGVARTSPAGGGGNPLQGAALGYVDQQFTRGLFQPFSSDLGQALGFSSFSFNADLTGGFSANASRNLGKNLTGSFNESSGPQGQRQSFALDAALRHDARLTLTLFGAGTGSRSIGVQSPLAALSPTNYRLETLAPPPGSSGYTLTYQRLFR